MYSLTNKHIKFNVTDEGRSGPTGKAAIIMPGAPNCNKGKLRYAKHTQF